MRNSFLRVSLYQREKTLSERYFEVRWIRQSLYKQAYILYFEKISEELFPPNPKELLSTWEI